MEADPLVVVAVVTVRQVMVRPMAAVAVTADQAVILLVVVAGKFISPTFTLTGS